MSIKDKVSRFGQHFMTDPIIIENIIEFADLKDTETVIEIGTGTGILTEAIAKTGCNLTSYEIDTTLESHHSILKEKYRNITIIYGNALKEELPQFDKIVANIPYNISEPLILKLSRYDFKEGILTVNKSFAEKMLDMEKESSLLALITPAYFDVEFLEIVPKSAFSPRPRISSAIISIRPIKKETLKDDTTKFITRILFDQRTKKTENALLEAIIDYKTLKDEKRYTQNESRALIETLQIDDRILEKKVIMLSYENLKIILDKIENKL
ncbi:MAG: ribosomal RNA small subunit methyltransferase A [Candidatus Aenigmarchaeota archaeon]|nr:ribosomal RNA small subunit methyltransferase A [Candidatus Aenigmarchaeota archaeon]